jgi:formamidopyrimidine-DNA glycosylase
MPEAPEILEVLEEQMVGATVKSAHVARPTILRNLVAQEFDADIVERPVEPVSRYGKTLTIRLSDDRYVLVIPMLTRPLVALDAEGSTSEAHLRRAWDVRRD